jgi:AmmeMemoRadiSam system protein B
VHASDLGRAKRETVVRQPAVAGRFYPRDPRELHRQVSSLLEGSAGQSKRAAIACVVPHAGYMYSGHVAGAVYGRLELPKRFLLLGPRHYPYGESLAINSEGSWQTPLGSARLDAELAAALKRAFPALREDTLAHRDEHSLEVQLPFLQFLALEFQFTPIVLGTVHFPTLVELGRAIAHVLQQQPEPVLMVASTDMNHYEPDDVTRVKDARAIEQMLRLDAAALYDTVRREDISMCGIAAAVVMFTAARELGAKRAELIRYATSGDVSGDRDAVVGYAGLAVE